MREVPVWSYSGFLLNNTCFLGSIVMLVKTMHMLTNRIMSNHIYN